VANIEELLMDAFIESKNNLDVFAQDVDKIHVMIQKGIEEYQAAKKQAGKVLDAEEDNAGGE
jgi:hypothetical protein